MCSTRVETGGIRDRLKNIAKRMQKNEESEDRQREWREERERRE